MLHTCLIKIFYVATVNKLFDYIYFVWSNTEFYKEKQNRTPNLGSIPNSENMNSFSSYRKIDVKVPEREFEMLPDAKQNPKPHFCVEDVKKMHSGEGKK